MSKTTKIIVAAAAAVGILMGGHLWINSAEKADKQAAIDTYHAFSEAMLELDIPKAQSMARGEAHASLVQLSQLLDKMENVTVSGLEKPPVNEFVYADSELRVLSDSGENLTVLRKTEGKWYVEEMPYTISKAIIPEILELISK